MDHFALFLDFHFISLEPYVAAMNFKPGEYSSIILLHSLQSRVRPLPVWAGRARTFIRYVRRGGGRLHGNEANRVRIPVCARGAKCTYGTSELAHQLINCTLSCDVNVAGSEKTRHIHQSIKIEQRLDFDVNNGRRLFQDAQEAKKVSERTVVR